MPHESHRGSHRNGGRVQVLPTTDTGDGMSKPHDARSTIASMPNLILYGLASFLVIFGLILLIIGSVYAVQCPLMPMVPTWLLVMGVIILVGGIWHAILARRIKKKPFTKIAPVEKTVTAVHFIIYIIWFIAGNVWVYKAWGAAPDYAHYWFSNYCNKGLFYLSFATMIGMDCIFGALLISASCWSLSQIIVRE